MQFELLNSLNTLDIKNHFIEVTIGKQFFYPLGKRNLQLDFSSSK